MPNIVIFDRYSLWLLSQDSYRQELKQNILILLIDGEKETEAEKEYWRDLLFRIHVTSHVWSLEDLGGGIHISMFAAAHEIHLYSNTDHLVKKLEEMTPQSKLFPKESLLTRGQFSEKDLNNLNKKLDALKE